MIEIEIPKDINKYEAKLIGPFTKREAGCFVCACVLGIPTFLFLRERVPMDLAAIVTMLIIIPFVLIGWINPYGMHFEQFARTAFVSNFIAPSKRKYVTMNQFELLFNPDFSYETVRKSINPSKKERNEFIKEANRTIKTDIKYYN